MTQLNQIPEQEDHQHDATTCGACGGDVPGAEGACPSMSDDRPCAPAACCAPRAVRSTTGCRRVDSDEVRS